MKGWTPCEHFQQCIGYCPICLRGLEGTLPLVTLIGVPSADPDVLLEAKKLYDMSLQLADALMRGGRDKSL